MLKGRTFLSSIRGILVGPLTHWNNFIFLLALILWVSAPTSAQTITDSCKLALQGDSPKEIVKKGMQLRWESFPKIPFESIENIQDLSDPDKNGYHGKGFLRLQTGRWNGKDVFIKTYSGNTGFWGYFWHEHGQRTYVEVLTEMRWLVTLEALGIPCAKFLGLSELDNHYLLVTERLEGVDFQCFARLPNHFIPAPHMLEDLERTENILRQARVRPLDPQFRLTPDGNAIAVDPEKFYRLSLRDLLLKDPYRELKKLKYRLAARLRRNSQKE